MATITGITAKRAQEIADASVISGAVNTMGNLELTTRGGIKIDAGHVKGDTGNTGAQGIPGIAGGVTALRDSTYGVPTTVTDQVALANKVPTWYNAVTKQIEVYMATTGMAGLLVPGVSGVPGWYVLSTYDNLPKGLLYENVAQTSVNGLTDNIVANIPSFTFKGGRKYRIVWDASYLQDNVGDLFFWCIFSAPVGDTATSLTNLTVIGGRTKGVVAGGLVTVHTGIITALYRPLVDITIQLKFRVQRVAGSGGVAVVSQNGERPSYQIFDDGMQF